MALPRNTPTWRTDGQTDGHRTALKTAAWRQTVIKRVYNENIVRKKRNVTYPHYEVVVLKLGRSLQWSKIHLIYITPSFLNFFHTYIIKGLTNRNQYNKTWYLLTYLLKEVNIRPCTAFWQWSPTQLGYCVLFSKECPVISALPKFDEFRSVEDCLRRDSCCTWLGRTVYRQCQRLVRLRSTGLGRTAQIEHRDG